MSLSFFFIAGKSSVGSETERGQIRARVWLPLYFPLDSPHSLGGMLPLGVHFAPCPHFPMNRILCGCLDSSRA